MKMTLVTLSLLLAPELLQAEVIYDGITLGRADKYDGYPSHLFRNGQHQMWWCSQGSDGYDAIYRATKTGSLGPGGWSTPARVFERSDSPWTARHTCDPSVIQGAFSYNGQSYSLALFYTSWKTLDCAPPATCPGGRNAVGVAYSNNGSTWTAYPTPVVVGDPNVLASYGVGQSGVAFDPLTSQFMHAHQDTSRSPTLRLNQTTNGRQFTPSPSLATLLLDAGRAGGGNAPDIAYNPPDDHWYAVIGTKFNNDVIGNDATRVLRAHAANTLTGAWEVIGVFNIELSGWDQTRTPVLLRRPAAISTSTPQAGLMCSYCRE